MNSALILNPDESGFTCLATWPLVIQENGRVYLDPLLDDRFIVRPMRFSSLEYFGRATDGLVERVGCCLYATVPPKREPAIYHQTLFDCTRLFTERISELSDAQRKVAIDAMVETTRSSHDYHTFRGIVSALAMMERFEKDQ